MGGPLAPIATLTPEWQAWKYQVDQLKLSVASLTTRIAASDARVLQDAGSLSANPNASHQPLANIFDASRATAQLKTNAAITAAFGREAYKTVGTVADQRRKAEVDKCKLAGIEKAADCTAATYWAEGGRYRILLHAAVGAASFGAAGAAGVVVAANAQTVLGEALTRQLNAAGIYDEATVNLLRSVISLAAGAAAGGAAGAASGFSVDANNRQLHRDETAYLKAKVTAWQLLRGGAISLAQAEQELTRGSLFDNDLKWQQSIKDWTPDQIATYRLAADYLRTQAARDGFKFTNLDGVAQAGFTSTAAQFQNAKYLLAQAWEDQATRALYQDRAAIKIKELGGYQFLAFGAMGLYGMGEGLPEGVANQLKLYRDTLDPATFKRLADAADQVRKQGLSATLDKLWSSISSGAQDAAMGTWMSWLQADSRTLGQSAGRVIGSGAVDAAALSLGIAIVQRSGAVAQGLSDLQAAISRSITAEKQVVNANVQALATTQTAARVYVGVELHPSLSAPAAGWDYMPSIVYNGGSENLYWSHFTGFQAEIRLANEVAATERVVKWGNKVNLHGADIVSVNTVTGEVTLWDSKFLSAERRIGESTTFSGATTRAAARLDAVAAIETAGLTPAQRQLALANLDAGNFTTKTVGSGGAKGYVMQRYCGSSPC